MATRKRRRSGQKEVSPVDHSASSTTGSDDEGSSYEATEEQGTGNVSSSQYASGEEENSDSSGELEKPVKDKGGKRRRCLLRTKKQSHRGIRELRSKRVHDKGRTDNVKGKGGPVTGNKGKSVGEQGKEVGNEGDGGSDVVVRHRCALEAVCSLNSELVDCQKLAIEGTVWGPILRYKPFDMDRHLVRALVESWVPETKSFRIGGREVPFSVYDVAVLTGLPATGKHVTFDEGQGACEVGEVVKEAMEEYLRRERARRRTGRTDVRVYRNYISVIVDLCKQYNTEETLGMFTKLYAVLVLSGLLFPRTAGGVTWELIGMADNVSGMAEYNWSQAVWSFLVEAIEDTKEKIPRTRNLQMHGFAMILQVQ